MKTFQEFITEAKFRGHRTPEEIAAIRAKRRERQTIEPQNDETGERLRTTLTQKLSKVKDPSKRQLLARQSFYKGRPAGLRDTTLDTRKNTAILVKNFSRDRQRLKKEKEDKNMILPSRHPDANYSSPEAAERADRLHLRRRKKRGMPTREEHRRQRREQEQQSRERDRQFRKAELKKTVGQIPGQLRDS